MGRNYNINAPQLASVNEKFTQKSEAKRTPQNPACHSSTLVPPAKKGENQEENDVPIFATPYGNGLTDFDEIEVQVFGKGGLKIEWPIDGPDIEPNEFDEYDARNSVREDIRRLNQSNQQSTKSRLRSAWTISNAETEWQFMTTLTYPVSNRPNDYDTTKKHRNGFLKRAKKFWPGSHIAWILEFQESTAAHYHIFWGGEAAEEMKKMPTETFEGKRFDGVIRNRKVVRGNADKKIVEWWTNQVGDGSEDFRKFQNGGITEYIQNESGAGRYVAKEAAKRSQKNAPFLVPQWWGITQSIRPVEQRRFKMTVGDYVRIYGETMKKHIF